MEKSLKNNILYILYEHNVYIALSYIPNHSAVHQITCCTLKLIHHCKSTIFQLKKMWKKEWCKFLEEIQHSYISSDRNHLLRNGSHCWPSKICFSSPMPKLQDKLISVVESTGYLETSWMLTQHCSLEEC